FKSGAFALAAFALVALLAAFVGAPPLSDEPREEWWFHWYSALAALLPPWAASAFYVGFPVLLIGLMLALPFIDHGGNRGLRRRPLAASFAIAGVSALLALTSLRLGSPWDTSPGAQAPPA